MKASFNGARMALHSAYNRLCYTEPRPDQMEAMNDLRCIVVALNCMYDPDVDGDCDDLSDAKIMEVPESTKEPT